MSQHSPYSEHPENSPSEIHQHVNGNLGGGQQAINNGSNNFQYQDNRQYFINVDYKLQDSDIESLKSSSRFCNYIKTLLFLFGSGVVWVFAGYFAKGAFPISDVWAILGKSLFNFGADALWEVARVKQNKLCDTSLDQLEAHDESSQEASRLNQLDSEYWLITKIIKLLSDDSSAVELQVEAAIEALKRRRFFLAADLDRLKKEFYPKLRRTQRIIKRTTISKDKRDNEKIERFINVLIKNFTSYSTSSSEESVRRMLDGYQRMLEGSSKNVSTSKLKLLYKIWYLLDWTHQNSQDEDPILEFHTDESGSIPLMQKYQQAS